MKRALTIGFSCIAFIALGSAPASANWGQEVKACNQSSCYPGGTSRGAYVSAQAQDGDGPGYAAEIHQLANPGNASPRGLGE
jgi:hypothetical protein